VLEVQEVTVRFGGKAALNNTSITVEPGAVTGLIGPNGAGKTTLFNVVTGLLAPNAGTVLLGGRDITSAAPHRRARMGLARTFQRLELFTSLTVRDNVRVAADIRRRWAARAATAAKAAAHTVAGSDGSDGADGSDGSAGVDAVAAATAHASGDETDWVLELTGLTALAEREVSEIPTGQARVVELARALMTQPSVLLLDEPAAGQTEAETAAFGDLLRRLAADGMAVCLVEHDMTLVMDVCEKIHVLDYGRTIAAGTPDEIRNDPAVVDAYLGTPEGVS
jgi:branched-chain amino acid transport system ATP-binding protein